MDKDYRHGCGHVCCDPEKDGYHDHAFRRAFCPLCAKVVN